MKVNMEI